MKETELFYVYLMYIASKKKLLPFRGTGVSSYSQLRFTLLLRLRPPLRESLQQVLRLRALQTCGYGESSWLP